MTGEPDPVGSLNGPKYLDDDRVVTPLNVTYPLPLNFIAETKPVSTNRSLHVLGVVAESRSVAAMLDTQAVSRPVVGAAASAPKGCKKSHQVLMQAWKPCCQVKTPPGKACVHFNVSQPRWFLRSVGS